MSGKSKRRRPRFKNKIRRQREAAQTAPAAVTPPVSTAVATPKATAPAAKMTPASTAASAAQYPFFTRELKRIGIISGIIIVVLIVLTVILT